MSNRDSDDDLHQRVRALEAAMSGFEPPAPARQRTRIRRTLVAFTTVIALGMLPMMTVASDVFRDLDDTHPFHDAANEMYTARITRGCATNPRRFCPDDAVSRGQAAGLLSRGLGRVTSSTGSAQGSSIVDSVTIQAGGLPGGRGYVLVNAGVTAYAQVEEFCAGCSDPCPCEVTIGVEKAGTDPGDFGATTAFNLVGPPAPPDNLIKASGAMAQVFLVPSGEATTFDLIAHVDKTDSGGVVNVGGYITALYVPLDGAVDE